MVQGGDKGLEAAHVDADKAGSGDAQRVVAPFGRYEGAGPAEHPLNYSLVGHERERARMLDWLFAHGSRG
jgi:hypothetical protein